MVKRFKQNIAVELFAIVIFVLCIFTPQFKFVPSVYTWVLALMGVFTLCDKGFVKIIHFYDNSNIKFWCYLLICFFFIAFTPLVHFTFDFTYLPIVLGIVLCSLRALLLLHICYSVDSKRMLDNYCKYFLCACDVCVVFTLLFIVFPSFKSFWLYNVLSNTFESDYGYYQFRYSLNGFAAFSDASILAFSCLIASYVIAKERKISVLQIIQFILSAIGCLFYGRVAIVGVVLGGLLVLFSRGDIIKKLKISMIIAMMFSVLLLLLNYLAEKYESFFYWRIWAFRILNQFFKGEEISDYSYNRVFKEMFFLPEFKTIFFGDGYYTDPFTGRYYMSTDVGYMRIVLYAGIMGMIVLFGLFIYILHYMYKKQTTHLEKTFIVTIFLLWLVLEAKGESYHRMIMMSYPYFLIMKNKKFRINNGVRC